MKQTQEFRFGILLLCLFGTLLIPPYFANSSVFSVIWRLVFSGVLLTAMYAIGGRRNALIPGLVLLIPALVSSWAEPYSNHNPVAFYIDNLTSIVFFVFVCVHLGRFVMATRTVTTNLIYASMCLYMLLGLLWAAIYANVNAYYSGAFNFATLDSNTLITTTRGLGHFVYFSFVTLTTLGYGDITPVHDVAQSWVLVESMVGQFYIAIVLARLVSLHASRQ